MPKLYVFGIGGTGSRVLKSLTMLLASGVKCNNFDTIVPIIIDYDVNNGDFIKTNDLIKNYRAINESMSSDDCSFFKTKIELLDHKLAITWDIKKSDFQTFIGSTGTDENQALVEMLFSRETLELPMEHGFQGNPNMGCVVQNQFEGNDVLDAFKTEIRDGDRVFIVSSIFGGTGASGFPLLRKWLHKSRTNNDGQWEVIRKAPIAAISVLPYYTVANADEDDNSTVCANEWNDKAKAALQYYLTEDKKLDLLYYIGDAKQSVYKHFKGGTKQTDPAHIVEMASALAILDFAQKPQSDFSINSNGERNTEYLEFGVKEDDKTDFKKLYFQESGISKLTGDLIVEPLSRFLLFAKFMGFHAIEKNKREKDAKHNARKVSDNAYDGKGVKSAWAVRNNFDTTFREHYLSQLDDFQINFVDWLIELEEQDGHSFSPYNLYSLRADEFVKSLALWNKGFLNSSWERFNKVLIDKHASIDISSMQKKFLRLFDIATAELITYKKK
ncbi:MAG: hypothetical protein PHH23_08655 [Paludibacteraceae bacterium]|nr:hypothetical protein [Paludibacteraceae bacterium]